MQVVNLIHQLVTTRKQTSVEIIKLTLQTVQDLMKNVTVQNLTAKNAGTLMIMMQDT